MAPRLARAPARVRRGRFVGFMFGRGADGTTCACDAAKDGVTNPPPIDGNTRVASADDDGGLLQGAVARVLQGRCAVAAAVTSSRVSATRSPRARRTGIRSSRARSGSTRREPVGALGGPAHRGARAAQLRRLGRAHRRDRGAVRRGGRRRRGADRAGRHQRRRRRAARSRTRRATCARMVDARPGLGLRVAVCDVLPWNNGWPGGGADPRAQRADRDRRFGVPLLPFHDTLEDPERPGRMRADWTDATATTRRSPATGGSASSRSGCRDRAQARIL